VLIEPADRDRMRAALALATETTPPGDVPVGALVLGPAGDILGRGVNRRELDNDPAGHAEVVALRAAAATLGSWRLDGATLVVTLEPCIMCAGALVQARISRLVFGAFDEKAGAAGSRWDLVRDPQLNHRPEVVGGVLPEETGALLSDFFAAQRRPETRT